MIKTFELTIKFYNLKDSWGKKQNIKEEGKMDKIIIACRTEYSKDDKEIKDLFSPKKKKIIKE